MADSGERGRRRQGAREDQWFKVHMLVCLKGWIKRWREFTGDGAVRSGGALVGGGTPVGERRR